MDQVFFLQESMQVLKYFSQLEWKLFLIVWEGKRFIFHLTSQFAVIQLNATDHFLVLGQVLETHGVHPLDSFSEFNKLVAKHLIQKLLKCLEWLVTPDQTFGYSTMLGYVCLSQSRNVTIPSLESFIVRFSK